MCRMGELRITASRQFPEQFCRKSRDFQFRMLSACKLLMVLVPREGFEPSRDYSQRILSPKSAPLPSLTKHNKPVFTGMFSRQSQLHSVRLRMESRHFHVIRPTEFRYVGLRQPILREHRLSVLFIFEVSYFA